MASANAFPTQLNKPEVKSLLKKHFTQAVFDQLKDKKTSRGITINDCIRSGVENLDSGVGLYAGDEECYTLFGPLFTPLIEDYHSPIQVKQSNILPT